MCAVRLESMGSEHCASFTWWRHLPENSATHKPLQTWNKAVSHDATNLRNAFDPMLAARAWRKRWRISAAAFITVSCIAGLATLQIKPRYESEASIFVRLGRESAGLDPTATTAEVAPIYETREQELNSALEVMSSRKLLEAAVAVIGKEVLLHPEQFSFDKWQQALKETDWKLLDPDRLHRSDRQLETAVETIYKALTLEVEQSSSVIGVTSVAATPDLAQAITKTMVEAFRAEHVRLNETSGLEFFTEQLVMLQTRLDRARLQMSQRKSELGIMSIEGERTRLEDVLTALEKQLNIAVPDLEGARASAQVMQLEVAALPDRTQPHDATDTLKKTLHELQQKRAMLLTRFTEQHFRLRDVDTEIQIVKGQLTDPANRNSANPTLRELEVALANDRTRVAQTEATIRELQRERNDIREQLMRLNDAEAEMAAMQDRIDEMKAAVIKASEKLEQARILDQLSKERISNIRVVQPPTFNPTSMSPSRSLVLATGLCIGCMAALIVPAIVEFAAWYLAVVRASDDTTLMNSRTGEMVPCGG